MSHAGFNWHTGYTSLPEYFFSENKPAAAPNPKVLLINQALATSMGLDLSSLSAQEQAEIFSGKTLLQGSQPFSQAYAGHQFGHFTFLGDGRAHVLGEHVAQDGQRFDIQLKGSGRTPYSRRGDGKAALGPMLREYLISEAMHHLKIPTTRSLALVLTGEAIWRGQQEQGAVLTRVASSHLRIGTFEFAAQKNGTQSVGALLDYTLKRHAPELLGSNNKALALLQHVAAQQADLVVHWLRVGFIHGVMNTDNLSISGETLDYGPCAFMDTYHPQQVFSSIDEHGRYAYGNQPTMAHWGLARLAEALLPLIDPRPEQAIGLAQETLAEFSRLYHHKWLEMIRAKLGLFGSDKGDQQLFMDLLNWAEKNKADYTNTFRDLSQLARPQGASYDTPEFEQWYQRWQERLLNNNRPLEQSLCLRQASNPEVIPRNHQVQRVLSAAEQGDMQPFHELLTVLQKPYQQREGLANYQSLPEPHERVYQTFCGT